jgi:hypothetical protein
MVSEFDPPMLMFIISRNYEESSVTCKLCDLTVHRAVVTTDTISLNDY